MSKKEFSTKDKAKSLVTPENKAYVTSDNNIHVIARDADIEGLKKHCADTNITLFDVEENKDIELTASKKKTKE